MCRYSFYLLISMLTFLVGSFVAVKVYWKNDLPTDEHQKVNNIDVASSVPNNQTQRPNFKYGCQKKELETFWERLDKDAFLKFKKTEIKIRNTYSDAHSPDNLKRFADEWSEFQKQFGCQYFSGINTDIEIKDLNGDDQQELSLVGEYSGYHGEAELFIFHKEKHKWKLILYDGNCQDAKVKSHKTNGYFDIELSTSVSGGSWYADTYKFNGKNYENVKCLSENMVIVKNGDVIGLKNPLIKREKCFKKFSQALN